MSGSVDFAYLEGFAAGDRTVVVEVLQIFLDQARIWQAGLASPEAGWRDLVHTIKGSGRGVGANALGAVAERAERDGPALAGELREALAAAMADIEAYLATA